MNAQLEAPTPAFGHRLNSEQLRAAIELVGRLAGGRGREAAAIAA